MTADAIAALFKSKRIIAFCTFGVIFFWNQLLQRPTLDAIFSTTTNGKRAPTSSIQSNDQTIAVLLNELKTVQSNDQTIAMLRGELKTQKERHQQEIRKTRLESSVPTAIQIPAQIPAASSTISPTSTPTAKPTTAATTENPTDRATNHGSLVVAHPKENTTQRFSGSRIPLAHFRDRLQLVKKRNHTMTNHSITSVRDDPSANPLCRGCLRPPKYPFLHKNKSTTCGSLIHTMMVQNASISLVAAGIATAREVPDHCHACHPENCTIGDKVYMEYDKAGPPEVHAWTMPASKVLQDKHQVLPREAVSNLSHYFLNRMPKYNRSDPSDVYRWEYNPSIVPVNLTSDISFQSVASLLEKSQPLYFYSRRVSVLSDVFDGLTEDELGPKGEFTRYWSSLERVEFGFMNANFDIVAEGVFRFPGGQDYRIFKFDGQVYFSTYGKLHPLFVTPINSTAPKRGPHRFTEVENTSSTQFLIEMESEWCCVNGCKGKNFNYFQAPLLPGDVNEDGSRTAIWVQTNPIEPVEIQRVAPCKALVKELRETNSTGFNNTAITRTFVDDSVMTPSFAAKEEPHLWANGHVQNFGMFTDHRGSACCLHLEHPESQQPLLVGIAHRKQFAKKEGNLGHRQYSSNFYATQAEPPFSLMALTGPFCLGHPTQSEAITNHLAPLTQRKNLTFGADPIDCPFITFISTIIDHPENPDTALIGYGINDMISRVIEVNKSAIVSMLFDPFGSN